MIRTFDVVALDADTEDAARLIGLLLDLRHAKNTLLLMFPIGKSDVRAAFMNRGFDMCLAENSPKECSAAVCALLRRPSADEYPTEAAPPGRIIYKDLILAPKGHNARKSALLYSSGVQAPLFPGQQSLYRLFQGTDL